MWSLDLRDLAEVQGSTVKTTYTLALGQRTRDVRDLAGQLAGSDLRETLTWKDVDAARWRYSTLRGEPPRLLLVLLGAELAKPEWDAAATLRPAIERIFDGLPVGVVPNDSVGYTPRHE